MRKKQKIFLGYLGLAATIVMTVIAIGVPSPGASATTSVTDNIQVRVVGSVPNVDIRGISNDTVYVDPSRVFEIDYENVETFVVTLRHTALDGTITEKIIDEASADFIAGTEDYTIRIVK